MEPTAPEVNVTPEMGSLARGRLGTWDIVFLVFAGMTPLVGLTSTNGLAMSLGSGSGIVGLYIVVGICVLIFQVGYSAMSTEITNAGPRLPDDRRLSRSVMSTSMAGRTSSSPPLVNPRPVRESGGIVWLRFRDSPFQPDWEVFDVSGPEGVQFDLNLLLDVDSDGDLDVVNSEEVDSAGDGRAGLGIVWYENPRERPDIRR